MKVEASTVFCDEIRREDNGKPILIGVYTDDLVPGTLPALFPLSVWKKAEGKDAGNHPFSVKSPSLAWKRNRKCEERLRWATLLHPSLSSLPGTPRKYIKLASLEWS